MQRFIVYVYFIKFIGITHFVYSGILLLYLIKQHIHQPFIRQWGSNGATITKQQKNFNIAFNKRCWSIIANYYDLSDALNLMDINIALQFNKTTGYTFFYNVQSTTGTSSYFWIAIGE